jgi:predicted N-acetyltransferase YhbS
MFRLSQETEEDRAEVEWLLDLAFAPGRGTLSSYRLRQHVAPISKLCFVARDEFDAVAGCIRYWPVQIGSKKAPALLLGPIAVHPTRQGEGLGAILIEDTLSIACELGWCRVILIGDEKYYRRFGFSANLTRELAFPQPYNPDRLLAVELNEGAFHGITGSVLSWDKNSEYSVSR